MKTVIITGASRGIGAQTAKLFAKNGYAVIINYNNSKDAAEKLKQSILSEGFVAEIFAADVSDYGECKKLADFAISKFKRIDALVNNAGVSVIKPLYETEIADLNKIIGVNFNGVFNMCKAVSPYMVSAKRGKIVNVSSVWGEKGSSCETVYCASKAAVIGFTKALAKELGPSNVNVNCIAPGFIDTQMNAALTNSIKNDIINETPLMRMGTADDVANCILFLAESASDFLTGQVIKVDGGWQI